MVVLNIYYRESDKRSAMKKANASSSADEASCGEPGPVREVGRLVDSSQADDRKMIRLVRERPVLYARNNMPVASYYNSVKALWRDVANEMGWSVADVRRKWSHIRNSYSRHLRNEMYGVRTGKGRMVSKWYLADELEFLREHMATDTRASPYSTRTLSTPYKREASESAATDLGDAKPLVEAAWVTMNQSAKIKKEPMLYNDDSSSSQGFTADENSSYFQFFRAIHGDYQGLAAKKQRLFKRQCLIILHDLLDEEDMPATLYQNCAINLSNSGHDSDDDKNTSVHIVDSYSLFQS
ncbi:uncharacterized protein [Epargyreus clarus]|uniref:uncharacterized protein n=1 Tax=Epargyreus clarus TaxID=520877 RepID=UPI003C2C552D